MFLIILLIFASSLLACTFTTQVPSVKTFKIWKFINQQNQYKKLKINIQLKSGISNNLAFNCNENKYHFFRKHKKGYAYSGLLGRIAPVSVHISMIILLLGSTLGSFSGYTAQEIIPRGEVFHIQNLNTFGNISYVPQTLFCRINNFWITYTKDLQTEQFYSDLSLFDEKGNEVKRKIIFVNEPLRYKNFTMYQTDWNIVGIKLLLNNEKLFQIPLHKMNDDIARFWVGSLYLNKVVETYLTIVFNDLSGSFFFYNPNGILLKKSYIGEYIFLLTNLKLQILDVVTSTGLQITSDPSLVIVYLAFFLLLISIYVSFFSYSQIWLIDFAETIKIGGNSNRSVLFFQEDFRKIIRRSINK